MEGKNNIINTPKKLTAKHGWYWINEGVRYFMQAKLAWIMSVFFVLFSAMFLVNFIPISQLILLFVFPFIAAGFSLACADIEKGKKMSVNYLFSAFSSPNRLNLFRYGLLLLLMIFIAQIIASLILNLMGVNLEQVTSELNLFKDNENASIQLLLANPVLLKYFVVTILSMLPIIIVNLLSPTVLVFSNLTAFQAIKLCFVAGTKNFSAFAVYASVFAIILFILVIVFNLLMSLLFQIFGNNSHIAVYLYLFIFVSSLLVVASLSYSSAYVAYKEIFLGED